MSQPEKSFRMGACSASVFVNEAEGGRQFRSVSLQRRYRQDDEWKTATTYTLTDLPNAIAVLQMAMAHIAERETDSD